MSLGLRLRYIRVWGNSHTNKTPEKNFKGEYCAYSKTIFIEFGTKSLFRSKRNLFLILSTFNKIKIQHSIRKNQFSSQFLIQNRGVKQRVCAMKLP